jgi:hypothetical protein
MIHRAEAKWRADGQLAVKKAVDHRLPDARACSFVASHYHFVPIR